MKLILTNGLELNPILVTGEHKYIQNQDRDVLSFIFDSKYSMDKLDSLFTESNCETIKLINENTEEESVYNGYVIRVELIKKTEELEPETSESTSVHVTRIHVSMAQRSYSETKIAQMNQELTDTQLAIAEIGQLL